MDGLLRSLATGGAPSENWQDQIWAAERGVYEPVARTARRSRAERFMRRK